jgi:hypothetical protein
MNQIVAKKELVAYCGLYCGCCKIYLNGKCKGCKENEKAAWCKLRVCCINKGINSCADCSEYSSPEKCKKFNNFMSKIFGLLFKSDRKACINLIREKGYENYALIMADSKNHTVKK